MVAFYADAILQSVSLPQSTVEHARNTESLPIYTHAMALKIYLSLLFTLFLIPRGHGKCTALFHPVLGHPVFTCDAPDKVEELKADKEDEDSEGEGLSGVGVGAAIFGVAGMAGLAALGYKNRDRALPACQAGVRKISATALKGRKKRVLASKFQPRRYHRLRSPF